MEAEKITGPSTLATSVYSRLREDVIGGVVDGALKIRDLCDRYGAGLSPVREALNRLATEGLITQIDQRGFWVTPLSIEELDELIRSRCLVEGLALRESIRLGGIEWEEQVLLAYHRLSRTPRHAGGEPGLRNPDWERAHSLFHATLIAACGMRQVRKFCAELFDAAERYRHAARVASAHTRNDVDEHRAIMEAAVSRDANLAVELLTQHFRLTATLVRQGLHENSGAAVGERVRRRTRLRKVGS